MRGPSRAQGMNATLEMNSLYSSIIHTTSDSEA